MASAPLPALKPAAGAPPASQLLVVPEVTPLENSVIAARHIHDLLAKDFKPRDAIKAAEALYEKGVEIVAAEVHEKPLENEFFTPAVDELDKTVSIPGLQHSRSIHTSLGKVYRIFMELTWYRCFGTKTSLLKETREHLITHSHNLVSSLPRGAIEARFEYKCAYQGAKIFEDASGTWEKYFEHIIEAGDKAYALSVSGVYKVLKKFLTDVRHAWVEGWYLDVFKFRWEATQIKTAEHFKDIIGKELPKLKHQGGKFTLAVAITLHELIERKGVDDEVKKSAFEALCGLLKLEVNNFAQALNSVPIHKVKKIAKQIDSFAKTRILTIQYLKELIKSAPTSYRDNGLKALKDLASHSVYADEKKVVEEILKQKEEGLQALQEKKESLDDRVGTLVLAGGSKGSADETKLKEAQLQLEQVTKSFDETEQQLESMKVVKNVIDEIVLKEQQHLLEALSELQR